MTSESLQCKTLVLRVSIHCEGCKKKVKKVLQSVDGVYRCDIDARSNKATVAVTGNIGADALVKRLRKSGKNAEQWPEEQTQQQQQQQQPTDTESSDETMNQATEPDKPGGGDAAEKPASGDVVTSAAEPSNPKASPEEPDKIIAGEAAKPAEDSADSTNADADADGDGAANHGAKEATAPEQWRDPKRNRKQQREEEEVKPVDAMAVVVAAASGQGSHASGHLPPPTQQQRHPVHVVSYSVARPSASAAYYAAAPPQEHPYSCPPCCHRYSQSQPSPYSCYHHGEGHLTPPTSAASPARDSYGDLFSDDNANSCSVM